jgi:hypothetical protein
MVIKFVRLSWIVWNFVEEFNVKNTADVWYFKIVSKERLPWEFVIEAITEMPQRLFFAPHEDC